MIEDGNGKEKTPEQLREERYKSDPSKFVEMSELVIAVKRTKEGMAYLIGNATVNELKVVKYDMDVQLDSAIFNIIQDNKSKVITHHGIMDFIRRRK